MYIIFASPYHGSDGYMEEVCLSARKPLEGQVTEYKEQQSLRKEEVRVDGWVKQDFHSGECYWRPI